MQLKGIKDLGDGHALRVATQVVETGQCPEVEEKRNDPKFLSLKVFDYGTFRNALIAVFVCSFFSRLSVASTEQVRRLPKSGML